MIPTPVYQRGLCSECRSPIIFRPSVGWEHVGAFRLHRARYQTGPWLQRSLAKDLTGQLSAAYVPMGDGRTSE